MKFMAAFAVCAGLQMLSFLPFWRAYRMDKERFGSDLGVPIQKRFAVWLVMCPVWALPFAAMLGG